MRLFSYEGNLKWVSLMLWLGADPRVKGPRQDARFEDDPECDATATEEACLSGKLEVLHRFKLVAGIHDLSGLLKDAAHFGHADIVRYLLDLGAEPNDKPNEGSSALDRRLWHLEFEDGDHLRYRKPITRYGVNQTIETLTILLKAGALWIPDDRGAALRFRRTLTKCEPALVLDLFKLFKAHGAVTPETIREYLDTPQMQKAAGRERVAFETPRSNFATEPHFVVRTVPTCSAIQPRAAL